MNRQHAAFKIEGRVFKSVFLIQTTTYMLVKKDMCQKLKIIRHFIVSPRFHKYALCFESV